MFVRHRSLADQNVKPSIYRHELALVVVTDRDFGDLIFHQGLTHTGVIFFRLPGAPLTMKIERLDSVLVDHADELTQGEFLVVNPNQIRVAGRSQRLTPTLGVCPRPDRPAASVRDFCSGAYTSKPIAPCLNSLIFCSE